MGISARAVFQPRNGLGRFVEGSIAPAVQASVQASLTLIQTAAKGYCPVDTGALRESITTEVDASGSTVVGKVGPHMFYASFVEYGTGRRGDPAVPHNQDWPGMAPQPFMRPALDENKGTILDVFKGNIRTALRNG